MINNKHYELFAKYYESLCIIINRHCNLRIKHRGASPPPPCSGAGQWGWELRNTSFSQFKIVYSMFSFFQMAMIQKSAPKYIRYLCAEDSASLWHWLAALRLAKVGHSCQLCLILYLYSFVYFTYMYFIFIRITSSIHQLCHFSIYIYSFVLYIFISYLFVLLVFVFLNI